MTTTSDSTELYYDPYDFAIDTDPYPVWKRMREEAPLYYNDKHDFYALSRFDDVAPALIDWETYRSGKGSILELIKANIDIPPGVILFEDPPIHDLHRGILSRVFTPRKMNSLEPKIREFTVRCLDPLVGSNGFDLTEKLGGEMPMRTIGFLLGIPESAQDEFRQASEGGMNLEEGSTGSAAVPDATLTNQRFGEYIDWRRKNPSDDLMTELIQAEFEDETGTTRTLTREEILTYVELLAGAGNETTTRLISWSGKLLAEHADQRAELVANHALIPNAIEEILRFEAPSPVQARYVARDVTHHGQKVAEGNVMLLMNGAANRDSSVFPDADRFDIHRSVDRHLSFGYGIHFCLGNALARLEGRVALEELLTRWPTWEIDWDNAQQAHTSTVRGWDNLPLTFP